MSAPLSPQTLRTIGRAGEITGRVCVGMLIGGLGVVTTLGGIEFIRSDAIAGDSWRTALGALCMFTAGAIFETAGSILLRAFR